MSLLAFCTSLEKCLFKTFQFSSVIQSHLTLCESMDCSIQAFLSITNSWSLLKLMSVESVSHFLLLTSTLGPGSHSPMSASTVRVSVLHLSGGGGAPYKV